MNIKRYNGAQPDGDKFSYIPVMFNHGESSGYVASIVRENADGSFGYCLIRKGGDLRSFNKEMTAALQGRGGGKPECQMGTVRCNAEAILKQFVSFYIPE